MSYMSCYNLYMDSQVTKSIYSNVLVWLNKSTCVGAAEAQALLTAIAHIRILLEAERSKGVSDAEQISK
jgi:hypothetical protein